MCPGRLLARLSEPLAREAMRAARALLAVAAGQSIYYQIDRSERNLPEYSGEVRPIRREKVDLAVSRYLEILQDRSERDLARPSWLISIQLAIHVSGFIEKAF